MAVNSSKKRDPRQWKKWGNSGAVPGIVPPYGISAPFQRRGRNELLRVVKQGMENSVRDEHYYDRRSCKPEFLALPKDQRQKLLIKVGIKTERIAEELENLYHKVSWMSRGDRLSPLEERTLELELWHVERKLAETVSLSNDIFKYSAESFGASRIFPYPLNKLHVLVWRNDPADPSRLKSIESFTNSLMEDHLVSKRFRVPWYG